MELEETTYEDKGQRGEAKEQVVEHLLFRVQRLHINTHIHMLHFWELERLPHCSLIQLPE